VLGREIVVKIKILLDTNFLLTTVRHKIYGFEEIKEKIPAEFFTLSRVIHEIKSLGKKEKKIKNEGVIVEQVLKNNNVKILDSTKEDVDSELVEYAKKGYVIATNDKELRRRIREADGKTIYIRSLTYIDIEDLVNY
jgi:rRNA-processing protein FCF1